MKMTTGALVIPIGLYIWAACLVYLACGQDDGDTAADTSGTAEEIAESSDTAPPPTTACDGEVPTAAPNGDGAATAVDTTPTCADAELISLQATAVALAASDAASYNGDVATSAIAAVDPATADTATADATAAAAATTDDNTVTVNNCSPTPIIESDDNILRFDLNSNNHVICICHLGYDPVCASNGITYSNRCIFRCISAHFESNGLPAITMLHHGKCSEVPCECPNIVEPVCGTNNQTYKNACYLACVNKHYAHSIKIAYKGCCRKPLCICPSCIIPVCGSNGKTYRNICLLQCHSNLNHAKGLPTIDVVNKGVCEREVCHCPPRYSPVCGSDGNTYDSKCALNCQNRRRIHLGLDLITIQYPGVCKKCNCPSDKALICASDGNTYTNYCWLLYENQKRKCAGLPELTVRWSGPCDCCCTKEWNPLCTTDSKTWPNRCVLDCENRRRKLDGLLPLIVSYKGECKHCDCSYCSDHDSPVCGSNRQSYRNICHLNCNSDCLVASGQPAIWKTEDKDCSC